MTLCYDSANAKEFSKNNLSSNLEVLKNTGPNRDRISVIVDDFNSISTQSYSGFPLYNAEQTTLIYSATNLINTLVTEEDTSNYTYITIRLNETPLITPIEIYDFVETNHVITPYNIEEFIQDKDYILGELDLYFSSGVTSSSMGTFCSMVPNIFGLLKDFSNFYNNIGAIKDKLSNLISGLQNLSVQSLLETLKTSIKSTIDKLADIKLKQIAKISLGVALIASKGRNSIAVYNKAMRLKDNITSFFTKENIQKIKDYVDGLITYSISVFKDPSIEEAQFLVFRYCALISNLEQVFNDQLEPLDFLIRSNNETYSILKASGNYNTGRAIQAGARRYTENEIQAGYDEGIKRNTEESRSYMPPPLSGDIDGVTPYNNGAGDSRLGFQGGWIKGIGEEGWTRVDIKVKIMIMRVQARLGKRLLINSGWRSPAYNKKVGGKSASKHLSGEALDVTWNGFGSSRDDMITFVNVCKEEGFRGFGYYYPGNSFIHVDIGPARSWGNPP